MKMVQNIVNSGVYRGGGENLTGIDGARGEGRQRTGNTDDGRCFQEVLRWSPQKLP